MEKKLASIFFSTRLMAFLFLAFAAAMAAGTFIENDYNTETARIWIYNAWWFEAIMVFFMINFLGNIKRYNLLTREKWPALMLHLAFILILLGAFITRYISYEGMMPIREGATENQIFSDKTYLTVFADGDYKGQPRRRVFEKPMLFSPVTNNDFTISEKFDEIPFEVNYKKFIMNASETVEKSDNGKLFLKMVEAGGGTRHEHFLQEGEVQNIHNMLFALNKFTKGAINITTTGDSYTIQTPFEGEFMRMADKLQGHVSKDSTQPLMMRSLYNIGGAQFVFPEPAIKGVKSLKSNNDFRDKQSDDALIVTVTSQGQSKDVTLTGAKGKMGQPVSVTIGKLDFTLFYGSKAYTLPFSIKLNDFIASKYPGSEKSYSAFESQVTVIDGKDKFDSRIYMNHVLDHKGFRFFQASFQPDEKGTVLSVNHDEWGTNITYLGYFLLFFGMLAILFHKKSRFGDLKRKLDKVKAKKEKMMLGLLLLGTFSLHAQQEPHKAPSLQEVEVFLSKNTVNEAHAEKFGRLIIQDDGGRMKPINTFSSELLRKVSKSDSYKDMNSDQVFLSMTQYPNAWFEVPLIYLKPGNDSIRKIIGIEKDAKYAPFIKFFDATGNYKLSPYLDAAYQAAVPDQFQKDFIEADRKVNLMNSALSGSILRIFPIPNDSNNKWISYMELNEAGLKGMDSTFTQQILPIYLMSLKNAADTGNYKEADFYLSGLAKFQSKYGSRVMPSREKISAEIAYNKYDIFKKLYYLYMLSGVVMLLLVIVNIFARKKAMNYAVNAFHFLIAFLFVLHTIGLAARWYISGHAPWSDAYESMIYVAWATMLFTLLFARKSKLTVASGTFVASMILMIAHWNWMDPSIANLKPVLDSYWLMIHVAVIVASYGPFTLGMVLGIVALLLMIFTNDRNRERMELNIKEITYINEMALTIGLVMLTIGNFLGGQWANESWGRYWGWDPKETWALISIMIYAFVIHARFVPALRGKWTFNLMSIVAYYSILMTYFGVNFYLTGLHSYASGDKVVTPSFVYWSVATVALLAAVSYVRFKKYKKHGHHKHDKEDKK
ncbi:MAG: cytochrome C biogenesis protein [Flavobacterium sp.]|nr:MAG: cytochrome C biogenesis protein [Flavobacterium sp.]